MTTLTLTLGAHVEDSDDGAGQIVWPATTALAANPGDLILKNRGPSTTYQSSDGSYSLVFGAYLDGISVVGAGTGTGGPSPHTPYDGPFCTVAPNQIDFSDEAFEQCVEIFGDVGYFPEIADGSGAPQYPVHLRSGDPIIQGSHVVEGVIAPLHLTQSHVINGSFPNGSLLVATSAGTSPRLIFVADHLHDPVEFHTANGDGDSLAASGWPDGSYFICSSYAHAPGIGVSVGYVCPEMIGFDATLYSAVWPGGTNVAGSMIAFTRYHPGSSTAVTYGTGGSLGPGQAGCVRYCFAKSLTVKAKISGADSTITQTIETPLSTPVDFLTANDGLSNHSVSVTLPPVPAGWSLRIYLSLVAHDQGPTMLLQTLGTNYTLFGNVLTLSSVDVSGKIASLGFSAWPSGTLLAKDPVAHSLLLKLAHVGTTIDPTTFTYDVEPYGATGSVNTGKDLSDSSVNTPHLNASNAAALNKLLAVDGADVKKVQYVDPASFVANPMTAEGDIIYGGAPSAGVAPPTRLGAGSAGTVLTSGGPGNPPSWGAAGGSMGNPMTKEGSLIGGGTGGAPVELTGPVDGGGAFVGGAAPYSAGYQSNRSPWVKGGTNGALMYYQDGTVPAAVTMGAANDPLVSNGPGNPPSFQGLIRLKNGVHAVTIDSNGHVIISGGGAPTLTVTNATISGTVITGNDMDFTVSFSTSAVSGANTITFTFAAAFANANYTIQLTDWNNGAPHQVTILSLTPAAGSLQLTATLSAPNNYRFDISIRPH